MRVQMCIQKFCIALSYVIIKIWSSLSKFWC